MIPLSDGVRAQTFPFVNVALIVANFAVWLFYELPNLNGSIAHASMYPCSLDGSCHAPLPWAISWLTSSFMHGSWDHILGNMLFLAIFGKNVEDAFGHLRYLAFYLVGGFVAASRDIVDLIVTGERNLVDLLPGRGAVRPLPRSRHGFLANLVYQQIAVGVRTGRVLAFGHRHTKANLANGAGFVGPDVGNRRIATLLGGAVLCL